MKTYKAVLLGITCSFAFSLSTAYATNGYWANGYGAKSKSIAGACVAMTFGAMCGATTNPASLVMMGNRLDYGLTWFAPKWGFTANENASPVIPSGSESSEDWFFIPHFSYNRMLDDNNSLGIYLAVNKTINSGYDSAVFKHFNNPRDSSAGASSPTGLDLRQLFLGVSYSRKLSKQHALGITPIFALQTLEAQGLQPFKPFSAYPYQMTDNGHDVSYGGGVRVGWLGKITPWLTLGASYQSPLWMSKFDDYKGLLAEEGDFDIPANYDLGFALHIIPELTLAFDYQRIEYGSVKAISNPSVLTLIPRQTIFGTENGLGFGWEDMDIIKLGFEWQASPNLTLRAGYSHANNPFPEKHGILNLIAPIVTRNHYTFGLSTSLSEQVEFNITFSYAPNEQLEGTIMNSEQTGYTEMEQYELGISWGINF